MKLVGTILNEQYYLIGANEIALYLTSTVLLYFVVVIVAYVLYKNKQKRRKFMNKLSDKDYKRYREFLDSM